MFRPLLLLFSGCLAACSAVAPLPASFAAESPKLIAYRDGSGGRVLPVPRSVSEAQRKNWRDWLAEHRNIWQTGYGETVSGATLWCVQWQEGKATERLCRRETALVWLGRGVSRDEAAIKAADGIWRPNAAAGSLKP